LIATFFIAFYFLVEGCGMSGVPAMPCIAMFETWLFVVSVVLPLQDDPLRIWNMGGTSLETCDKVETQKTNKHLNQWQKRTPRIRVKLTCWKAKTYENQQTSHPMTKKNNKEKSEN